jgi:hypothetical protein
MQLRVTTIEFRGMVQGNATNLLQKACVARGMGTQLLSNQAANPLNTSLITPGAATPTTSHSAQPVAAAAWAGGDPQLTWLPWRKRQDATSAAMSPDAALFLPLCSGTCLLTTAGSGTFGGRSRQWWLNAITPARFPQRCSPAASQQQVRDQPTTANATSGRCSGGF